MTSWPCLWWTRRSVWWGIVTVDDAMDVIQEEATEDMERMAAIAPSDKPYMKVSIFENWKKRAPWLLF